MATFSIPKSVNEVSDNKRRRISIIAVNNNNDDPAYNSDDSVNLDNFSEPHSELSGSSVSEENDGTSTESEADSVGSMDLSNPNSTTYIAKDKTIWVDKMNTSNLKTFTPFEPEMNSEKCHNCITPLGILY